MGSLSLLLLLSIRYFNSSVEVEITEGDDNIPRKNHKRQSWLYILTGGKYVFNFTFDHWIPIVDADI